MEPSTQIDSPNSEEDVQLPDQLASLSSRLEESPESLALGNKDIQVAALQAAKYVFDLAVQSESKSRAAINELLNSLLPSTAPQTRSKAAKANGKNVEQPQIKAPTLVETPLPELCVEGMDKEQIWAQLELRAQTVAAVLDFTLESTGELAESDEENTEISSMKQRDALVGEDEDADMDMDFDDEDSEDDDDDDDEDDSEDDDESEEEDTDVDAEGEMDLGEAVTGLRDPSDDDEEDTMDLDASGPKRSTRHRGKGKAHPELDDGFFDLAAFNAETEAAESRSVSKGRLSRDDDDSEDDGAEDELDLFTAVDAPGDEEEPEELFYKDFFAPPSRKTLKARGSQPSAGTSKAAKKTTVRFHDEVKVKNIKAKGKNLPLSATFEDFTGGDDDDEYGEMGEGEDEYADEDEDEDLDAEDGSDDDASEEDEDMGSEDDSEGPNERLNTQETMGRIRDDLFADEEESETEGLTTHEKRMADLQDEIAALEAENVAPKPWTLMGEATSRSRPQNALLEEDLEFERLMKSVPVITEEVVQSLEEQIKARILDNRFDDVVRKRPVDDKPFLPSRLFELQDTKSKQSLAEIYEDEYTAAKTGGVLGEDRDGKLKREHEEIEKLWENLCAKMDALSNAHFTPKAPKASISTISNIASASLESALPTSKATSTMLAPEEIFAPSSTDRARSELTPAEKRALHNKQKKAKRKARDTLEKSVDQFARMKGIGGVKKQKEAALKSVVKSGKGVTVIGKRSKDADGSKDSRKKPRS